MPPRRRRKRERPRAIPVTSVPPPTGATGPVEVYVNGEQWHEGEDFQVRDGQVHFTRSLRAQPKLKAGRKLMLAVGIGVYGDLRRDTLDLRYTLNGSPQMVNIPLKEA